jgi:membrane-associated phospholipid phosphatase
MHMRSLSYRAVITVVFVACGVAAPLRAQTDVEHPLVAASAVASPTLSEAGEPLVALAAIDFSRQVIQQPAGPPPTPRHTGIRAMLKGLVIDLKYLPSRENLFWAGVGGGLALAVHPVDDDLNRALVGDNTAENIFKAGEVLGQLGTLLGSASVVYAVGRLKDQPKVSHVGMDLIQSLAIAEGLTQTLKYATRRERPDLSGRNSFPSGHAADTFAFATALERHLGWRYAAPAYAFSSYVAISRLPANRHWFSDTVFGAAVGIIAGRTVTSHEAHPFPVVVTSVPGGAAVSYVHRTE